MQLGFLHLRICQFIGVVLMYTLWYGVSEYKIYMAC